ncbi:MAG TPA: DUF3034 family protein [Terriglobales bacterium]|nr:DUF3034 family protein [Terriglobales bacterium]
MSNQMRYCETEPGAVRCGMHFASGLIGALLFAVVLGTGAIASAQSLNWEGQTGVFVTPLAYTVPSTDKGLSLPVVAYHFLNAGPVLGDFHQVSITEGAFGRVEFGYSRDLHEEGNTPSLSMLWSSGFNAFHGKLNFLRERRSWVPAFAVGFVARSQVQNVGGVISNKETTNQDFYVVATKTVTQIRKLPLVFNLGFKATNASLLGLAGNAPAYKGRLFGAAAFALKGPGKSTILLGSEFLQEPRNVEGVPDAVIPTTITYAIRIVPAGALPLHGWGVESPKLTIDLGVAQVAGNVMQGVNLQAQHQFALGVSYEF